MRTAVLTLFALAAAGGARAEPYALFGASRTEGLTMIDVASVARGGANPRAWAYVVLPEQKPQRIYLEASELEFDCARSRTRMVSAVRYDAAHKPLARTDKVTAWEKTAPGSPIAGMHRQVCAGAFDPSIVRGYGKTVPQYANEMRPLLSKLEK